MDGKKLALVIALITVLANCVFAFTGVSHTLSCSVASGVATAYAAFIEPE